MTKYEQLCVKFHAMKKAVLIMIVSFTSLFSGDEWQLRKSGSYFKAFTKGGSDKHYKIEAEFECDADSVFSFLTNYEKFPEPFESICSLDILSSSDSVTVHYSVI